MTYRPWKPVQIVASKDRAPRYDIEISDTQHRCLRLLAEGRAREDEQKIALQAIMWMCGADDQEFLPDEHGGERDTAFKSGKRFVGLQLRKLIGLNLQEHGENK